MKTNKIKMVLGWIGCMILFSPVYCQLPKRVISFTTLQQKYFSIPNSVEFGQVNTLDYNKMIAEDKTISTEISIDRGNNPTITTIYHVSPRYQNDYENEITKSVTGNGQTILYDYNNNEVKRTRHNPEENMELQLRNEDISKYGLFNNLFLTNPQIMYNHLYQMGFEVRFLTSRNSLIAISEEIEIFVNFRDFIYEIRYFEDREFLHSITSYYQEVQGVLIPHSTITCATSSLEGEIQMLTTTVTRYLEYRVVNEEGKDIVHFISKDDIEPTRNMQISSFEEVQKRDIELQVFPNPTSEQITLVIPFFMEHGTTVEIINITGTTVYKKEHIKELSCQLDVSFLTKGIYLIKCSGNGEQLTTKFVKQ